MKQVVFLSLIVLASALAVVVVRHESRQVFLEVRSAEIVRDRLNEEWGRLQLEQATWSLHSLVEQEARQELGMVTPGAQDIVVLQLGSTQ